jgi:hypothetical protein
LEVFNCLVSTNHQCVMFVNLYKKENMFVLFVTCLFIFLFQRKRVVESIEISNLSHKKPRQHNLDQTKKNIHPDFLLRCFTVSLF